MVNENLYFILYIFGVTCLPIYENEAYDLDVNWRVQMLSFEFGFIP